MELSLFINYFGVIIIALFLYARILNIRDLSKTKIVAFAIFTITVAALLSTNILFTQIIVLISVCIFLRIMFFMDERNFRLSVAVIAVGISMGLQIFGFVILLFTNTIIVMVYITNYYVQTGEVFSEDNLEYLFVGIQHPVIYQLINLMISIAFVKLLSKIKRLKKGFIFLENRKAMCIGVILSTLIITANIIISIVSLLGTSLIDEELIETAAFNPLYIYILLLILLTFIVVCLIGIHFWWKNHTSRQYQQRLNERIIQDSQAEIKDLQKSNELLSATIHRDNKLIPAMYNALSTYLENGYDNSNPAEMKAKGLHLLNELEEIMQERKVMILKNQRENKTLPSTNIERIDAIFNYMLSKATDKNIEFDFVLAGSIKDIAENVIPKQKLETLLADLIDNAIIATSYSERKRVLVTMGVVDNHLEITIQDSGIPFEIETLANLGIENSVMYQISDS